MEKMEQPNVDLDWADEDPGNCARCNTPWNWVRPGKAQPSCNCYDKIREGYDK